MGDKNNNPSGAALDDALASVASIGRAQGLSDDAFVDAARTAYARAGAATEYTSRFRSVAVRAADVPKIQTIARQRVGDALREVEELAEACAMLTDPDRDEDLAEITTGSLFTAAAVSR